MTGRQRLTFLAIAAAIAVAAVLVLTLGGGDEKAQRADRTTPAPTPTAGAAATASPTATPTPEQSPVLQAGTVTKIRVAQGDTVRFEARNDAPEEVHVHGYDLKDDVAPGKPAKFSFPAKITGIFEIELEHSGTQIGQLRVDP